MPAPLPPLPEGPGLVFVVCGPAGSGKTTLCAALLEAAPRACRLVTCTSRPPRPGEHDGVDYHFLTQKNFETALAAGEFFEHARVHGSLYGSRKRDLAALLSQKRDILLNIDVQGAATIRTMIAADPALHGRLVTIFLLPPPLQKLRARLLARSQDSAEEIERRLSAATSEVSQWAEFDYALPAGTRGEDLRRLTAVYVAERLRHRPGTTSPPAWDYTPPSK